MSATILVHRVGSHLVPADRLAAEDIEKFSPTRPVLLEARQPRSTQHHRLFFALLRKVADNMENVTENALLSWLKVQLGYVEYLPLGFGKSYAAPASIAFSKMTQPEFMVFFNKAVDLICSDVIPGLGKPALLREVEEMVADKRAA